VDSIRSPLTEKIEAAREHAIRAIAESARCTGCFEDNMIKSYAAWYNQCLQALLTGDEKEKQRIWDYVERIGKEFKTGQIGAQLRDFVDLHQMGIPIEYLPTERWFAYWRFLEGRGYPPEIVEFTRKAEKRGKAPTVALLDYFFPQVLEEIINERDRRILQHVDTYGHDNNILYIGGRHSIDPVEARRLGITCYKGVFMEEDPPQLISFYPQNVGEALNEAGREHNFYVANIPPRSYSRGK